MITRYENNKIKNIFSDKEKYKIYYIIEHANAYLYYLKSENLELNNFNLLNEIEITDEDLIEILDNEKETKHETVAFVNFFSKKISKTNPELNLYIHKYLTSSDLIDTTTMIQMKNSFEVIKNLVVQLSDAIYLKMLSVPYDVNIMARTHGQHALPVSLKSIFNQWVAHLDLWLKDYQKTNLFYTKISGPVGQNKNEIQTILEELIVKNYGMSKDFLHIQDTITQILPRTIYSKIMFSLILLASSLEKIAIEIRLHSQTGINEFYEPFTESQSGSSSMPNKRNPIICENICGLSRILRSYMNPCLENIPTWNHRDISHSSVERIIIPDSFHLTATMLEKTKYVIENLEINFPKIKQNLNSITESTIDFHNYLKQKGLNHDSAYEIAKKISQESDSNEEYFLAKAKYYGFTKKS